MKKVLFLVLVLLSAVACKKVDAEEQAKLDNSKIKDYLSTYSINATAADNGLYYIIEDDGVGVFPTANSDVRVVYKGYYTNNSVFDESPEDGIEFNLQQVIKGWTQGIPFFKQGAKGKLFIPSALAYGTAGSGNVPPNSVLIFDIHVLEVLN